MPTGTPAPNLADIAQSARRAYVERVTGSSGAPDWWTAVIVTASSARQAGRYESEIRRRKDGGALPPGTRYLVVPDLDDARIGSGGATLNALRGLAEQALTADARNLREWWNRQRVFVIHSGGDSRRLPEYSLAGKLFSALPVKTPWGEVSTVFDEMLALSTGWAARLDAGLLVSSGDVILTFPPDQLDWGRPGVSGVAMREPAEVGSQHGVYVLGDQGRVYSFLQKPSAAEVRAAGGMLAGDQVALDIGLIRFDPATASILTELAGVRLSEGELAFDDGVLGSGADDRPYIDLYEDITFALTGESASGDVEDPRIRRVRESLRGLPFWCSLVEGDFTHVGTTSHFLRLMTEDSGFRDLYTAQQRLGSVSPPGVSSAGVIVDSIFTAGAELGTGSVAIECYLKHPVRAGRNAILHGLIDIPSAVEVPDETVVHQTAVKLDDGRQGTVIRVYGVRDDPKASVSSDQATWFGRPMMSVLEDFGLDPESVWPGVPVGERGLWNASLFPVGAAAESWDAVRWLLALDSGLTREDWEASHRLSLAASAAWADMEAMADARTRRLRANWRLAAVALAESGTDVRPLLARSPGVTALADSGRTLERQGRRLEAERITDAASRYYQASLFLGQAGLEADAQASTKAAFRCVREAVESGCKGRETVAVERWRHDAVEVAAPARVDFGGGWSDTPPFCLDWGGTVLNLAVALDGKYPISTTVRRIGEPVVRCVTDDGTTAELRTTDDVLVELGPGSALAIPRAALLMFGIAAPGVPLRERLSALGGGIEIHTNVDLPMGSGLGTSSILAASLLRALAGLSGAKMDDASLSDHVMRLEQLLTTGGGWQDQVGGIFPDAKLVTTGPGLRQRIRVKPLEWTAERRSEFGDRFILYYTGIRRVAKHLLSQVVGSYLAREVSTVQVLHSIKTLAVEMSYAMTDGEWDYLGSLMDRHWELNQILDPHTTNAPIDSLLAELRPHLAGAKLAGAGGGGFLMLVARDGGSAQALKEKLSSSSNRLPGRLFEYEIATGGLVVRFG